jgi:hypothetical protein
MNWSTTLGVAKTEALAAAYKLVATTKGQQMGTDNNKPRQWWECPGIGGAAVAQRPHGSAVGVRGGRWACYGVGGVAVGRWCW